MHPLSRKILLALAVSALAAVMGPDALLAQESDDITRDFVISAYYSPLPGQARYVTGSYTGDIRLNGGGVTTASGVKVRDAGGGFVAAPPNIPFGTKMHIHGMGTFEVLDRGGAIKGNRLDVWMGYGDEGLKRALEWGKRRVTVTIYGIDESIVPSQEFTYSYENLPEYKKTNVNDPLDFRRDLDIGDEGEDVARLQQILKDLGYFNDTVNGVYNRDTKEAVLAFQLDQGLLKEPEFQRSGRFGSFSRKKLRAVVANGREKILKKVPSRNLGRGASGEDVKKLQEILYKLGYLDVVTGVYDAGTVEAVLDFQLNEGVIESTENRGAGYFGPATQMALDQVVLTIENDIFNPPVKYENADETLDTDLSFSYAPANEMFTVYLKEGDSGEEVAKLQRILSNLNYLRIDPTGYFGPVTSHAVFKFQQRLGIVNDKSDAAAGYVGPETRKALNGFVNKRQKIATFKKEKRNRIAASSDKASQSGILFDIGMRLGDRGIEVKELQNFLKDNGYFKGAFTTEYFGEVTKEALSNFKVDHNIVESVENPDAGVLDSRTLDVIKGLM